MGTCPIQSSVTGIMKISVILSPGVEIYMTKIFLNLTNYHDNPSLLEGHFPNPRLLTF